MQYFDHVVRAECRLTPNYSSPRTDEENKKMLVRWRHLRLNQLFLLRTASSKLTVASLGWVSPEAATEGVIPILSLKNDDLFCSSPTSFVHYSL